MDRIRRDRPTVSQPTTDAPDPARTVGDPKSRPAQVTPKLRAGGLTGTSFVAQRGRVKGTVRQEELRATSEDGEIRSAHALRLKNKSGDLVEIPAHNYYVDAQGDARESLGALAELVRARPPSAQARINTALTQLHGDHEMSFRVKDPEKGTYDKIFVVPVHGTPVPITAAHYDLLIRSTEPVMQALRDMLQVIYTKPNATAKELGLGGLPAADQDRVLRSIRESVYFEPRLVHPAMKDYPFLSVGGFDAAIGDLDQPQPIFFEFNLGTPSGLSNNVQLQEGLRTQDPELFKTIAGRLPDDATFAILKQTIDSCAQRWTGHDKGISVVLGPGVYNGAHPDVASIALFSGMPLVNPNDLYVDRHGDVRLDTGKPGEEHPIVTGVYGRMEESYFLQDSREGVPIRGPDFEDNAAIGARLGVKLEPGIAYWFEYDAKDNVTGVKRDPQGKPLLMPCFGGGLGSDPSRPGEPQGSFLQAILGKKLYYSGLGGRVVDDKRIFQAIADHLAPARARSPDAPIARPPRTLDPAEYDKFYSAADLTRFVVKEPDKSGGSGVYLLVNMDPDDRRRVVEDVKKDPGRFIVQEFADIAVMISTEPGADGKPVYGTRACDARIFPMMDADGNVRAGPNAVLLRVANTASASTNTSQGASYGIAVVLQDQEGPPKDKVLPEVPRQKVIGASRRKDLVTFLELLNKLTAAVRRGEVPAELAFGVAHQQRLVMDLIGREHAPFMTAARALGSMSPAAAREVVEKFRADLFADRRFTARGVSELVHQTLAAVQSPVSLATEAAAPRADLAKLLAGAQLEPRGAERVRVEDVGGRTVEKWLGDAVRRTGDKNVDARIAVLERAGGELRQLGLRDAASGSALPEPASSYFDVSPSGQPIVGLDLSAPRALAALEHEFAHFKLWKTERDLLIKGGMPRDAAAREALVRLNTPEGRLRTERAAVEAELMALTVKSPFNTGDPGPMRATDRGYISRVCYPELEAIRESLHGARWSGKARDPELEGRLLDDVLRRALDLREARFEARLGEATKLDRAGKLGDAALTKSRAFEELAEPLFDLIWSAGDQDRLRTDGTLGEVVAAFEAAVQRARPEGLVPGDSERLQAQSQARRILESVAQQQ